MRFSGFAFARELGSLLAAAPAPFVAALLLTYGNHRPWGVAWYIVALSLITALSLIVGSETRTSDIEADEMSDLNADY